MNEKSEKRESKSSHRDETKTKRVQVGSWKGREKEEKGYLAMSNTRERSRRVRDKKSSVDVIILGDALEEFSFCVVEGMESLLQ